MVNQKRILWVDQLKGFTFFLVILGHCSGTLAQGELHSYIYSFHMPLFMMATGFTLNIDKTYESSFVSYFTKLFKRIVVPYLWLNLLSLPLRWFYYCVQRDMELNVEGFLRGILFANTAMENAPSPATPTYYVLLLFFAQLVLWLIIRLTKKNLTAMTVFSLVLLYFSLSTIKQSYIWHINVIPVALFLVLIGRLLMNAYLSAEEKINSLSLPKLTAVIASLLAIGFLFWKENGKGSIHLNLYGNDFTMYIICAVATSVAIVLAVMRIPEIRLVSFVGKNTLFYLGIHAAFLSIIEYAFIDVKNELWFVLLETTVVYLLLAPLTSLVNKTLPFLGGIPSKKDSPFIYLCRYLCTVAAGSVPVLYFCQKLHGGFLLEGNMKYVSAAAYLAVCVLIWLSFEKLFPFMLCKEKKKKEN